MSYRILSYQCDPEPNSPSDIDFETEILCQRSDGRIRPLVRLVVRVPRSGEDEPKVELGVFAEELSRGKTTDQYQTSIVRYGSLINDV